MKKILFLLSLTFINTAFTQATTEVVAPPNIKSVKLFQQNNQESLPIINLNSSDLLEFHFDDLDGGFTKNYYYTYQLCNADWSEAEISQFDYIKGFTQNRIVEARPSSNTISRYVHYQTILPDRNCIPSKSGNYLLKVFLDGDADKVVFTKRMYVLKSNAAITAQILQPFDNTTYRTHQKIQFTVNTGQLNLYNPAQQLKVSLFQNNRLDNAKYNLQPAFMRENLFEYNGEEDCTFPAGKEYRWLDLRSFRFESDRVARRDESKNPIDVYVKPDGSRISQRYLYMKDLNGWYDIVTTDLVNNWWQTGYANVHFTYVPDKNKPYDGQDVYIIGEFTGNDVGKENKMIFNEDKGVYEKTLLLKQGYYSYTYLTRDAKDKDAKSSFELTDGDYWETENDYSIFVYYRSFSGRYDELVGYTTLNSKLGGRLF